jgi:hypothetical protein
MHSSDDLGWNMQMEGPDQIDREASDEFDWDAKMVGSGDLIGTHLMNLAGMQNWMVLVNLHGTHRMNSAGMHKWMV